MRRRVPADQAEDYAQDVYVRVLNRLEDQDPHMVRPYVFKSAFHYLCDIWKKTTIETEDFDTIKDELTDLIDPEREVSARQILAEVDQVLATLPPLTRQAFYLCRIQGWSHEQIAAHLGIEKLQVRRFIEQALYRLHTRISEGGPRD